MSVNRQPSRQRGITLLVGMIMLIMLTMMAIAAFKFGKSNFMIVGNMQVRAETDRAAQQIIEQMVNNTSIAYTCYDIATGTNPCKSDLFGTGSNSIGVDFNGDGSSDVTVRVTKAPECVRTRVILNSEILPTDPRAPCTSGQDPTKFGVENATTGPSYCSDVTWEFDVQATGSFSQSSSSLTQGVAQVMSTNKVAYDCQ